MSTIAMPVRNDFPAYKFAVDLENTTYFCQWNYNQRLGRWTMNILDVDENPIVEGVPMLTDVFLFGQYVYESMPPGIFAVVDVTGDRENPARDDFGDDKLLLYRESDG